MKGAESGGEKWLDGELKLAGIDAKMMALLQAIADTGSISQAAKHCGLSYKGAWQVIERANNTSPHALISTTTGGSKGGGACLTESGRALLDLFTSLQTQHRRFLELLNQSLVDNPATYLLLQRLAVKTSVRNQLFGKVADIQPGAVTAKVLVNLSDNLVIEVMLNLQTLTNLALETGMEAVLLINSADIIITTDAGFFSTANRLFGTVIRIQKDDIHAEVTALLSNGETLTSLVTRQSTDTMGLVAGSKIAVLFNANAPVMGVKQS